jgi:hypothetical protein
MKAVLAATVAMLAMATASHAATYVSSVNGPDDNTGRTVLYDFNSGDPGNITGNYTITTGTAAQKFAAPLGDTTPYLVVPGNGSSGTAVLDLGKGYTGLSFYWGSIDSYNTVEFFSGVGGTGTSLGSFAGNNIPVAPANGDQGSALNNRRVFFNFGGDTAQSIRFTSSQIAFELDDIATTNVPEPSTWATLIAGLTLVGLSMRRRERNRTVNA